MGRQCGGHREPSGFYAVIVRLGREAYHRVYGARDDRLLGWRKGTISSREKNGGA